MRLSVKLPKFLVIQNHRLGLLQLSLQILLLAYFVHDFMKTQGYLMQKVPAGYPTSWAEFTPETLAAARNADLKRDFCTKPEKYTYRYSELWTYEGFRCVGLPSNEMSFKEGKNIIYFPVYFQEKYAEVQRSPEDCAKLEKDCATRPGFTFIPPSQTGPVSCECFEGPNHFFTTGSDSITMAFAHFFQVEKQVSDIQEGYSSLKAKEAEKNGLEAMITIVQRLGEAVEIDCNRPKKGYCRYLPGEDIGMTVGEWLRMGGVDLDNDLNDRVRANQLEDDSVFPFPSLRITGVEVMVRLKYLNHHMHSEVDLETGLAWTGPVCYVEVLSTKVWTGMTKTDYGLPIRASGGSGGSSRERVYEGIRFVFSSSMDSRFGWIDLPTIISKLTTVIVFLTLPSKLVMAIAVYCLGNLSYTYQRAQQEKLSIWETSRRGLPARLLTAATAFFVLSNVEPAEEAAQKEGDAGAAASDNKATSGDEKKGQIAEGAAGGVSLPLLEDMLKEAFRREMHRIDEKELKAMAWEIFRSFTSRDGKGHKKKAMSRITLEDFVSAAVSDDCMDYHALVEQFDTDRKKSFMERLFEDGGGDDGGDEDSASLDVESCACFDACSKRRRRRKSSSMVAPDAGCSSEASAVVETEGQTNSIGTAAAASAAPVALPDPPGGREAATSGDREEKTGVVTPSETEKDLQGEAAAEAAPPPPAPTEEAAPKAPNA